MYSVSEAYIEQMMKRGTRRRITGTIGSVAFTGADIVLNSFSITGRATEESDTKIGGVYLGEMELTFVPSFLSKIARDQYEGKQVSISIGLWIPDEEDLVNGGAWEDVPCGIYTLEAPKISKQGISVSGYDNMQKLDKKFNIDQTTGTIYDFLSYIATECHVTIGNTQEELEALPNGTELLGIYTENDIETHRDFLYWIAQTCGCFACAGRDGKIYLRKFGIENDVELDEMHRDIDVVFSGYTTKWTGISIVDIATKYTRYYGLPVDDGLTMNLGSNPLLQAGTQEAVDRRRNAVLYAIADIQYTPFYVNSARDCIFDLGDEISFTGGLSGDSTGCVMAYSYTLNNYNFEGYGDNPALANGRSKTDKNIAGLLQSTVENEVTYFNYSNLSAITFGSETETTLASIRFTSAQLTTVKILHEFIFDMVSDLALDGSYEIRYYLDDELLTYSPYERLGAISQLTAGDTTDVSICRDFFYILKDVEPNIAHTWQARIITHNISSTTIDVGNAHVTVEGQRMYSEEAFDGYIDAYDNISIVAFGYLVPDAISDTSTVSFFDASTHHYSASDYIGCYDFSTMQEVNITDSVDIYMQGGFLRITENDDTRITEDGNRRFTE